MGETSAEKQAQKWGLIAGILVALFLLNRWRQNRKVKKILKAKAKVSAQAEKMRGKAKPAEEGKGRGKRGKKKGKERSIIEQLLRFAIFQFMKKVISEQIKQMEVDLSKSKVGKKLAGAAEEA